MRKKEINEIFRKYKSDNEIYHDLMPLRTREILLVASIYDAFTLEQDGLLSEVVFGGFYRLTLSNAPRITNVSTEEEAIERLKSRHYDMVIVMSRVNLAEAIEFSRRVKTIDDALPLMLLLNDNNEIGHIEQKRSELMEYYDNVFVWNGNSEIFLAMVKYIEDKVNVYNDTNIGLVRVILLVEDSIRYYSRYMPLLYTEIMKQTQRLVHEKNIDEMTRMLRMRARPKVILASSFEEALDQFETYKDYLLCVISDVKYPKDGVLDDFAGVKLVKELKSRNPDLPILLQSSDAEGRVIARDLDVTFIHKNSETLATELANFFYNNLGFGDFIFRNSSGAEIARATTMEDLKAKLNVIPQESLIFHASRNHFSAWLMARGEIQIAQVVFKTKVSDFKNSDELRTFLINVGEWIGRIKTKGKIVPFDESYVGEDHHILRLAEGSLGGKGRGISFVNSLLANIEMDDLLPEVSVRIPQTLIIGIDEFTSFVERNKLQELIQQAAEIDTVKRRFMMGHFSPELREKLRRFLEKAHFPLAVRSSGLLEDSISHPLSGLYQTYFLPNNDPDLMIRLNHLCEAIKLVYASVYSRSARAYFEAIDYKIEEERMGIVIQQVVGRTYGTRYYPHVSGVAQSYNYYPFSYIQPQDGVGMIAIGLGKYVVGGEQSFRFCPAYPQLDMMTPEEQVRNTQKRFYALDLSKTMVDLFNGEDATLLTLDIKDAEADGALEHCASTWDVADGRIRDGLDSKGPRILNFSNILKYESFPLAKTLGRMLEIIKDSMETPVEIEFAIDLTPDRDGRPTFYLLQIKHLLRDTEDFVLAPESLERDQLFLYTNKGMGNGRIDGLTEILWVDPLLFDKSTTRELAVEIEKLNVKFKQEGKKYILIGPGRWGTRDRWLGIPISWPQISHAKIIVEYSMEGFQVDASLGSHFFHNVTSLNIGYFSIPYPMNPSFIDWDWLKKQPEVSRQGCLVHSRCAEPVSIIMDGRKGISVIFKTPVVTVQPDPALCAPL